VTRVVSAKLTSSGPAMRAESVSPSEASVSETSPVTKKPRVAPAGIG